MRSFAANIRELYLQSAWPETDTTDADCAEFAAYVGLGAMELLAWVAAVFASFLPKRHWCRFPSLPVATAAPVAALVSLSVAIVVGIGGFMSYADGVMSHTGQLQMSIAERQVRGELPESAVVSTGPMAVALLSPLAFVFFTPTGQLSAYFTLTSLLRSLAWVTNEPVGDPLLSALDSAFDKASARFRSCVARYARHRQEGAAVADRLHEGAWAGLPDVDFVVVASRQKPEWLPGTTVAAADDWFTLGVPFDRHTPDGLRTIYPLTRQPVTAVLRRVVHYELPPLRRGPKARSAGGH